MKIEKENELFKPFLGSGYPIRFHNPFSKSDEVWATDGLSLIKVEQALLRGEYDILDLKFKSPLPNVNKIIAKSEIEKAIESVDKIEETEEKEVTCLDCNGTGTVIWEYETYEMEAECPICDGVGTIMGNVKTGRLVANPDVFIKIDQCIVKVSQLMKVLFAINFFGVNEITHIHASGHINDFRITEGVTVSLCAAKTADYTTEIKYKES